MRSLHFTSPIRGGREGANKVISAQDYYAFGAPMPGRSFSEGGYRFGVNGKEKVDEIPKTGAGVRKNRMRVFAPE